MRGKQPEDSSCSKGPGIDAPLSAFRLIMTQAARLLASMAGAVLLLSTTVQSARAEPVEAKVRLGFSTGTPLSGRILVFAQRIEDADKPVEALDIYVARPYATWIAAKDVQSLATGATTIVDADTDAFPEPWSKLPPGRYRFQALLDRNGDYNYFSRSAGDLTSDLVEATLPGPIPVLTLTKAIAPAPDPADAALKEYLAQIEPVDFVSPALSAFWGRPVHIRGSIALPPHYDPKARAGWPVAFATQGFGEDYGWTRESAALALRDMQQGLRPPMIWVALDQSLASGTHEFADSVNNGPWGLALTHEFIPWLERHYRIDPASRFLTGHSSGGWAALWLQVRYPNLFAGAWPTAPDPTDFHDFSGADLYRRGANAYFDTAGRPIWIVRINGQNISTVKALSQTEAALGPVGGQMSSFDWVFSPKGPDGRPLQLFDRRSGAVDPVVAQYWTSHYDIAALIEHYPPAVKSRLNGKIHLLVGDADTFSLDRTARTFEQHVKRIGVRADFRYLAGKDHLQLEGDGPDARNLLRCISWEMYSTARRGHSAAAKRVCRPISSISEYSAEQ